MGHTVCLEHVCMTSSSFKSTVLFIETRQTVLVPTRMSKSTYPQGKSKIRYVIVLVKVRKIYQYLGTVVRTYCLFDLGRVGRKKRERTTDERSEVVCCGVRLSV